MAELRGTIVGRWPVAVLAVAAVAALSLGDLFAGWYSFAGRGSSAPGEYPIRIVLPQALPIGAENPVVALAADVGTADGQAIADAGVPATALGDASPGDARLAETDGPTPRPGTNGLLAIEFDLTDPGAFREDDGASAIEIRKAVRLNGADAGNARIRVGASSTLSIAREELGRLLARAGQQELIEHLGAGGQFVSFDEMRRQGIEVRYDPVSDRILVST